MVKHVVTAIFFSFLFHCTKPSSQKPFQSIQVFVDKPLHVVSERYLSVAVDSALVVGGKWWSGSDQSRGGRGILHATPLDFSNPQLRGLTKRLSPAYLRIGGSEADYIYYGMSSTTEVEAPSPYATVLTARQWNAIHDFISALNLELIFTVNGGPSSRDEKNVWLRDNFLELVQYTARSNQRVAVWELGNEVDAYFLVHGWASIVGNRQYASDYKLFAEILKSQFPAAKIAGPGSAYWPILGEMIPFLTTVTAGLLLQLPDQTLDILNWHFYPTQSRRCPAAVRSANMKTMLSPSTLNSAPYWAASIRNLQKSHAPSAEMWLSESGPAQCGGEPGVSDRFGSGLWYVDQLGSMAQTGQRVFVRQSLLGSDYGMLEEATLRPRPDYWNAVLWKRFMGQTVFDIKTTGLPESLRIYAHCTPKNSPHYVLGAVTLLAINLDSKAQKLPHVETLPGPSDTYTVDSPSLDSQEVRVNGQHLTELVFDTAFPGAADQTQTSDADIPPYSYQYRVFRNANVPACHRTP